MGAAAPSVLFPLLLPTLSAGSDPKDQLPSTQHKLSLWGSLLNVLLSPLALLLEFFFRGMVYDVASTSSWVFGASGVFRLSRSSLTISIQFRPIRCFTADLHSGFWISTLYHSLFVGGNSSPRPPHTGGGGASHVRRDLKAWRQTSTSAHSPVPGPQAPPTVASGGAGLNARGRGLCAVRQGPKGARHHARGGR